MMIYLYTCSSVSSSGVGAGAALTEYANKLSIVGTEKAPRFQLETKGEDL